MPRTVDLSDLDDTLDDLSYPVERGTVAAELDDVTLMYADGREALTGVLARVDNESFTDPEDLRDALFSVMPTAAVGEPGQSEGEG